LKAETQVQLEGLKRRLVEKAGQLCASSLPQGVKRYPKKEDVSRSQLQNLVNAACGTSTVAELENYLRYQIGRQGQDGWRTMQPEAKQQLGQALLVCLSAVCEIAGPPTDSELQLEAVRHFLGYLHREAVYRGAITQS
jgi:hypothetical protein